jgi:hypothetical protein
VEDHETQAPVQDLNYQDFQVFDNGSLLGSVVFMSGSSDRSRPMAMWLLVSCPEQGQREGGSGFVAGNSTALKQALANLDSASTVGVAHWCANGDANTDLLPTQDHDAPFAVLETVLHQAPVEPSKSSSKRAFQRALDLVMEKSGTRTDEALPVIVLLYDGSIDVSKDDADLMAKKLLYRRAIFYQIGNRRDEPKGLHPEEEHSSLQSISRQTGGRVYSIRREDYLKAMNSVISGLHFRYTKA